MANLLLQTLRRASSRLNPCLCSKQILRKPGPIFTLSRLFISTASTPTNFLSRNLVLSNEKLRPRISEFDDITTGGGPSLRRMIEPPKEEKWKTKKRPKLQRKREADNKRDPRRLGVKGKEKRRRFANADERIKYEHERVCAKT